MNAIHEKCSDGKLVCRAEHALPDEVMVISDKLRTGRWMIEFYENSMGAEAAKFCRTRLGNLPEDTVMMGSKGGIIIAVPAPKY